MHTDDHNINFCILYESFPGAKVTKACCHVIEVLQLLFWHSNFTSRCRHSFIMVKVISLEEVRPAPAAQSRRKRGVCQRHLLQWRAGWQRSNGWRRVGDPWQGWERGWWWWLVWCGVVCVVCCPPCMPARAGATGQTLLRSCAVDAVLGWGAIRDTGCCGHGSPTGAVCIPDTHAICASVGCCCEPGRQTQRRQVVLGRHRRQRLRHHKVPVRGASTGASLRLLCSILI